MGMAPEEEEVEGAWFDDVFVELLPPSLTSANPLIFRPSATLSSEVRLS